jgi:TetR/AcrR family transcriptional regulator, mexJK operon transcriptional repressor
MASVLEGGARGAVGGSGPKGEAIARAAMRLFLADGYERTSVDAIAAEAGVSKRTIYNRYGDKERLFLSVLRETFSAMLATFRSIADAHFPEDGAATGSSVPPRSSVPPGEDTLEPDLTAFVLEAARTLWADPERNALVRLILTEAPFFPSLLREEVGEQGTHGTLARVLSRLARSGQLAVSDPAEAAEHLFALTFAQVSTRSMFAPLSDAEVERIVTGSVRVFLRAYRPD